MYAVRWIMILSIACLVFVFPVAANAYLENVPRMSKETLRDMLESPDLVVLDIRSGLDWDASEFLIQGAERKDPRDAGNWLKDVPKGKTIVLYCA